MFTAPAFEIALCLLAVIYAAEGLVVLIYADGALRRLENTEARWRYLSRLVENNRMDEATVAYTFFQRQYEKEAALPFTEDPWHWTLSVAAAFPAFFGALLIWSCTLDHVSIVPERFSWKETFFWPLTIRAVSCDMRVRLTAHARHTKKIRAKIRVHQPA